MYEVGIIILMLFWLVSCIVVWMKKEDKDVSRTVSSIESIIRHVDSGRISISLVAFVYGLCAVIAISVNFFFFYVCYSTFFAYNNIVLGVYGLSVVLNVQGAYCAWKVYKNIILNHIPISECSSIFSIENSIERKTARAINTAFALSGFVMAIKKFLFM